jgi:Flp pilus assembly pilin Flp
MGKFILPAAIEYSLIAAGISLSIITVVASIVLK